MEIAKSYNLSLHLESCINEVLRKTLQFGSIDEVVWLFQVEIVKGERLLVRERENDIFDM